MDSYDYIIVGAGISGCSVAHELLKYSNSVLLVDSFSTVASGASGAAGAFLSPLLGKPNYLKDLVAKSLSYSTQLYKSNFPHVINNCGTTRIPKNETDKKKFLEFIPYMDFKYTIDNKGYFFDIGSVVNSFGVCKMMTTAFVSSRNQNRIKTKFNHKVKNIHYDGVYWYLDDSLKAKNIILTTGANLDLINESYLQIKPLWGKRIDITTTTNLNHNYHKECSVSKSFQIDENRYKVSIGATHHRKLEDIDSTLDIEKLLARTNDIVDLDDVEVIKEYIGARACSFDYLPIVGELVDSKKTIEEFPTLLNGENINSSKYTKYKNLYILNGVGGRGFVLAPYLAKVLIDNIVNGIKIDESITAQRLFTKNVKRGNDE